jgi:hypothetical protein
MIFCALAAAFIVLRVYQLYLNQWLQIRWRRWMTAQYVGHWLDGANHYRISRAASRMLSLLKCSSPAGALVQPKPSIGASSMKSSLPLN